MTNGFRVLALVLGEVPADSVEHEAYGLGMIIVGVILLAIVEFGLSKTISWRRRPSDSARDPSGADTPAPTPAPPPPPTPSGQAHAPPLIWRMAGLCVVTMAVLGLLWRVPPGTWTSPAVMKFNIELLPRTLEGRKARGLRNDDRFLGSLAFRHRLFRSYEREGEAPIRVFVGIEDDFHRNRNGLSRKTRIPRSGWLGLEPIEGPSFEPENGESLLIRYPREEILLDHYRMGYAPWAAELVSELVWTRPTGGREA